MAMVRFVISPNDHLLTLQQFLQKEDRRFSVREIKEALSQNRCLVNLSIERFGSRRLHRGDQIDLIEFTKEELVPPHFTYEESRLLLENAFLLAYDKPANITSLDGGLLEILEKEKGILFPLHRLDKPTSGVILFAKTKEAEKELLQSFKKREVTKEYLALVQGILPRKKGSITSYLGKVGEFQGQTIIGPVSKSKGQFAETEWSVLKEGKNASLLSLKPKTGRTHQLRSHMSSLGHPLLGDVHYGWKRPIDFFPKTFFLHALRLKFIDRETEELRTVEAPIPHSFQSALKTLFGKSL